MELQQLIIYAEYLKGGPTFRYLTDLTDGYTRKLVLIKEEDSAHKALQTMKEELDLQKFSNIRVLSRVISLTQRPGQYTKALKMGDALDASCSSVFGMRRAPASAAVSRPIFCV